MTAVAQADSLLVLPDTSVVADTLLVPSDTSLVVPDTLLIPSDTPAAIADTLDLPIPRTPIVQLRGPQSGIGITGVPARQAVFNIPSLFHAVPGAFVYDLAVSGAPSLVALGLTHPDRVSLTLDDRPVEDMFTGRSALERLPEDYLSPIHLDPHSTTSPNGLLAESRAFASAVPITELRYRAGPNGYQFVGATHAQSRRPNWVRRFSGDQARLSMLFNITGHSDDGEYTNAKTNGFQLYGRVGLALPGWSLSVSQRHLRRTEQTWGGVSPSAPAYFSRSAAVVNSTGERRVIQSDFAVDLRAQLLDDLPATSGSAYWTFASLRHNTSATQAEGDRFGLVLGQALPLGIHRIHLRAHVHTGRIWWSNTIPDHALGTEFGFTVSDSISVSGFDLFGAAGWHQSPGFSTPSARLQVARNISGMRIFAGVSSGASRITPIERFGWGDQTQPFGGDPIPERVHSITAGLSAGYGPLSLELDADFRNQNGIRALMIDNSGNAQFVQAEGLLQRVLFTGKLGFRENHDRGLYAVVHGSTQVVIDDSASELHRRERQALPQFWGYGRLGFRAAGMFNNSLDLDIYTAMRGWSPFRSRVEHLPTGLSALPALTMQTVPASGVVDLGLEGTIGNGRATVFLAYQNALANMAYPGVFVTPIYPISNPGLRIGVFWLLPY